jgi:PAS domain S-box-containing protein
MSWRRLTVGVNVGRVSQPDRRRLAADRFRAAAELLPLPFGIYRAARDPAGQIVDFTIDYLNPIAAQALGIPRTELIGKRMSQVFPGQRESGLFQAFCRVVATGDAFFEREIDYRDVYGGKRPIKGLIELRVVRFGDGYLATWQDITERRQAEEQVAAFRGELERRARAHRDAVAINDEVLSQLANGRDQLANGDLDGGLATVDAALGAVREIVSALYEEADVPPGALRGADESATVG